MKSVYCSDLFDGDDCDDDDDDDDVGKVPPFQWHLLPCSPEFVSNNILGTECRSLTLLSYAVHLALSLTPFVLIIHVGVYLVVGSVK